MSNMEKYKPCSIVDDKRIIQKIYLSEDEQIFLCKEVDAIIPYWESGDMAPVVWFAIYCDKQIVRRVNGRLVEVVVYL